MAERNHKYNEHLQEIPFPICLSHPHLYLSRPPPSLPFRTQLIPDHSGKRSNDSRNRNRNPYFEMNARSIWTLPKPNSSTFCSGKCGNKGGSESHTYTLGGAYMSYSNIKCMDVKIFVLNSNILLTHEKISWRKYPEIMYLLQKKLTEIP